MEKAAETSFGSRRGMRRDSRSIGMSSLFTLLSVTSLGKCDRSHGKTTPEKVAWQFSQVRN